VASRKDLEITIWKKGHGTGRSVRIGVTSTIDKDDP
jgi:hypothetical protein